jgi:hypothetical protein
MSETVYSHGLPCTVFRSDVDCTNGGVTSTTWRVTVVLDPEAVALLAAKGEDFGWHRTKVDQEAGLELNDYGEPTSRPALRISVRSIGGETYLTAYPLGRRWKNRHLMMGGNFVYSCDSRFRRLCAYPIPVHDRCEG